MNRPVVLTAVVAVLVGILAGFLWWGTPANRLQTELRDARARAEQLDAQLKAQKSRLESAERGLRREKEINSRLQMLVSQGKK